jgi:hypothetical protein
MIRRTAGLVLLLSVATPVVGGAGAPLPAPLELRYVLHYGALTAGQVTKTLKASSDGSYEHHTRSRPEGMARLFTQVEWIEEGRFDVVDGRVRPLRFLEYRIGADRSHRQEAVFDWAAHQIHYATGAVAAIVANTQDQGSLFFSLMLNPPTSPRPQPIAISGGKKLKTYEYRDAGQETLKTAFGALRTRIVERVGRGKKDEVFRVWLATDHHNLPVRLSTLARGEDAVLDLEAATGAITLARPASK